MTLRKATLVTRPALMGVALAGLKGKTRSEIESIGSTIFASKLLPNLNKIGVSEMLKKRNEGYGVVILSGAFDFILKPFCSFYEIDQWQSTRLSYTNDICTGQLEGGEFLGEAKRLYLQRNFPQSNIDWTQSCAYSDELVDLPLFSMVGTKFLVQTDANKEAPLPEGILRVSW